MTQTPSLSDLTAHLEKLLDTAQNKKLLMEEAAVISKKALETEEIIMTHLDSLEQTQKDIKTVQLIFDTREKIWDLVDKITAIEANLRVKTLGEKKAAQATSPKEECSCAHHHTCHSHEERDCRCHEHECDCAKQDKKGKTCRKKPCGK